MAIRYFHIPVPSPPTAFYHDMLLTEHWAIIVDSSLRREPSRLLFGKGLAFFNSSYNMRFRVSTITKDIKRYLQPIQVWTSSTKRSGSGGDDLAGVQWSWPCLAHCLCLGGDRAEGGRSFEQNSFRLKVVVWAPKFDSYSDDVPIHLPREEPSHLTKFTLDLVSLSVTEEKVIDGWWLSMTWPSSQLWICLKWFLLSSPSLRFLWLFMIICPLLSFCLLAWWKDQAPLHKCPLALSTWGVFFISFSPRSVSKY